ncbi:MAG TPA: hypothetical protein VF845_07350 [Terriglobales bacterium]
MNPLAWKQCAPRLATALATMAILLVTAGCGNGSPIIRSLGGGFTNASLNGQYVITETGIGVNQAGTASDPFSETIVFTADGNRNLNITVDDFDQVGGPFILPAPLTGTYSISSDGIGSLSFNGSHYAITMIDDSHFYVIQQDNFATASGFGEKQDITAFSAAPSGTFVFKAHNISSSSRVGGVTITGGAISGTEDLLTLGLLSSSKPITGSFSATPPDSNGRSTFTLDDGSSFNYYVVSSGKFHFMSNSTSGSLEIGQAEKQTGGPFSVATLAAGTSYVFGSSGDTNFAAGIHSAGVFTSDGNGHITAGAVDFVQDATVNSNLLVSGGSYTLDATSGNGEIDLTVSVGTIKQKFWMVNGTRAYFLADSTAAVEDGTFSLQQGAPFSALGSQAAFFMDGFDVTFKDRVGAFQPTSSGFKWNQAANAFNDTIGVGTLTNTATNGTAQVGSNGRVTVTVNGVTNTNSLVFYLSSPGTGFMVQEDADIGGAFSQQASQ